MEHEFTPVILRALKNHFGDEALDLFDKSPLLQYLNLKTVSATRGSKARSSFANLYAVYVLVEDYIEHGFHEKGDYSQYEESGSPICSGVSDSCPLAASSRTTL